MAKTVMVVDDEQDIRDTVQTILEANGYEVVTAVNGEDCLKKLSKKVNLILLDIMMPGMSVKELVPKLKHARIAYMTVMRPVELEHDGLMSFENVVGHIQKPFEIQTLVKKVKEFTT